MNALLGTLEDKLGKRGYDLEDLIARRKRELRLLKEAGLPVGFTPNGEPIAAGIPEEEPGETDDATEEDSEVTA
jgi:capsid protein